MSSNDFVAEIRTFMLSYGEHDPDCPGVEANAWHDQSTVSVCGFAPRLDELMSKLNAALAGDRS